MVVKTMTVVVTLLWPMQGPIANLNDHLASPFTNNGVCFHSACKIYGCPTVVWTRIAPVAEEHSPIDVCGVPQASPLPQSSRPEVDGGAGGKGRTHRYMGSHPHSMRREWSFSVGRLHCPG